jgi:hypothetical protein
LSRLLVVSTGLPFCVVGLAMKEWLRVDEGDGVDYENDMHEYSRAQLGIICSVRGWG